jgi:hypothetical protein
MSQENVGTVRRLVEGFYDDAERVVSMLDAGGRRQRA